MWRGQNKDIFDRSKELAGTDKVRSFVHFEPIDLIICHRRGTAATRSSCFIPLYRVQSGMVRLLSATREIDRNTGDVGKLMDARRNLECALTEVSRISRLIQNTGKA